MPDTHKRTHEGVIKMTTESASTEILSKRGDVVFHVGRAPQTERKLLISSALLSHVSPVLAAMFDGRFAEGQALVSESPPTIVLSEDDADAMAIVCKIAHACTTDVATFTTPTKLANIALICHKYDCIEVVRAWSLLWIADIMENPLAPDFEKMLEATYLLDLAPEFREVSKSLIRERSELLTASAMANGHDFLPYQLLERIVREQHDAQICAWGVLGPIVQPSPMCERVHRYIGEICLSLRTVGLWPMSPRSIKDIQSRLKNRCHPKLCAARSTCYISSCPCGWDYSIASVITQSIENVYDSVKGVCLDCAKRSSVGADHACQEDCYASSLIYT